MIWFLVSAAVIVVLAVTTAAVAWAGVARDFIRLLDRLTRRSSA